ncbi:MAG: hypothetical protein RL684_1974 [Pseudomonadota bacterium]|jgi:hypothetical protein
MTPADLARAPVAEPQPTRTEQQLRADDAWHRAAFAPSPELQALWMGRLNELKGASA